MEQYITDERIGLNYELVGDYYLIAGDDEPEHEPIGIWGQRHCKYLREHKHTTYSALLVSGKLDSYLRDIDRQAETMFSRMAKQMAAQEGITEDLKASDQMAWVGTMNSIRQRATEICQSQNNLCINDKSRGIRSRLFHCYSVFSDACIVSTLFCGIICSQVFKPF